MYSRHIVDLCCSSSTVKARCSFSFKFSLSVGTLYEILMFLFFENMDSSLTLLQTI